MVDASAGESVTVSVLLDVPGDWLINCPTEDDYPALIFRFSTKSLRGRSTPADACPRNALTP